MGAAPPCLPQHRRDAQAEQGQSADVPEMEKRTSQGVRSIIMKGENTTGA